MTNAQASQAPVPAGGPPVCYESVIPNPKLTLLDQMREVLHVQLGQNTTRNQPGF